MVEKRFKLERLPSWVLGMEITYNRFVDNEGEIETRCSCPFYDNGDDGWGSNCNLSHSPVLEKKLAEIEKKMRDRKFLEWKARKTSEYLELQREFNAIDVQCPLLEEDNKE